MAVANSLSVRVLIIFPSAADSPGAGVGKLATSTSWEKFIGLCEPPSGLPSED
jgi:hypothetical protein